jgi:flagellar protein FlaI
MQKTKTIKKYDVILYGIPVKVKVAEGEMVRNYNIHFPEISAATESILESVKHDILKETKISAQEIFDIKAIEGLKEDFMKKSRDILTKRLPKTDPGTMNTLVCHLLCEMIGLGPLEVPLADPALEEVVINTAEEPAWVFHRRYGWLKTNILLHSEHMIQNYASIIARRVGRQITTLEPLLDAHLVTGDRANATLFPVSTKGNTITIRKFRRKPWTITDFIANQTLTPEVAAFMWLIIQYELNMIIAGGTSSGKTALLNSLMPFIQPNHRIISIEDTRELRLPDFLHWVPLTSRLPNPEGKGEVTMLDLMVNSLRMRPDRMVVGEIRRGPQAEVLFEAMHTGHSVYATLHADTAEQVVKRMTNPPINIPHVMLEAMHLVVVQYRDRRKGIRRTYQVAELLPAGEVEERRKAKVSILYRLRPDGNITAHNPCVRVFDVLRMHTGMIDSEIVADLKEKMEVLNYMVKKNINDVNNVGMTIADYYSDKDSLMKKIRRK